MSTAIVTWDEPTPSYRREEITLPIYSCHGGLDGAEIYQKLDFKAGQHAVTSKLVLTSIYVTYDDREAKLSRDEIRVTPFVTGGTPIYELGDNGPYYLGMGHHACSKASWQDAVRRLRALLDTVTD